MWNIFIISECNEYIFIVNANHKHLLEPVYNSCVLDISLSTKFSKTGIIPNCH